ncbi:MAG: hypothetical protein P1U89_15825 [Verrucomicrobiales bacterium]|nr:hypothetical protein [Verrucomicrobiales bacterium]
MESNDSETLIDRLVAGEASDFEVARLSEMVGRDPTLAEELREELQFSEWIRHAVRDDASAQDQSLFDSLEFRDLSVEERVSLARDGDLSSAAADELARNLLDAPDLAANLRSELFEDEMIAQIVSSAKSENAFVDSLVTRMWAETNEDHFVEDFSKKLEEIEREQPDNVVAFPGRSWKTKVAAVASLAAAVAIGAFFITSGLESSLSSGAVAKIRKSTVDAIWAPDSQPNREGKFVKGTYRLESGAVSIELADGKSLAVQGPAVFEVDDSGDAVLLEGIALATSDRTDLTTGQPIGIGLSAKNVRFSKGAITVGLDARSSDSTEAIVFSGETGICMSESTICRDVYEFEAIKADHSHSKFVDVPYNPRAFSKAWELVSGIEKNLGDIVIELPGITSSSKQSDSGEIRVFVERERFKPESTMEVDVIRPGYFASSSDSKTEGRALASNGEEMRSYLLQLWKNEDQPEDEEIEASMTFDHPVVGVIFSSERLWESDRMVGASTQHLAENSNRGLDSIGDQILLSEDGRTLNLKLKSNATDIDQVRVLVALK